MGLDANWIWPFGNPPQPTAHKWRITMAHAIIHSVHLISDSLIQSDPVIPIPSSDSPHRLRSQAKSSPLRHPPPPSPASASAAELEPRRPKWRPRARRSRCRPPPPSAAAGSPAPGPGAGSSRPSAAAPSEVGLLLFRWSMGKARGWRVDCSFDWVLLQRR